jgi:hypothetical protein
VNFKLQISNCKLGSLPRKFFFALSIRVLEED